jgi:hypothetical protein
MRSGAVTVVDVAEKLRKHCKTVLPVNNLLDIHRMSCA